MQFYMYDFSEWLPISLNDDGLFSIRPQHEYFSKPTTKFYVITVDGENAGFASVDDEVNHPDTNHNIGYFFIARKFRRKGVAKFVVAELLARFSGGWQIFHITENLGAAVFWKNVIPKLTGEKFSTHDENIDGYACTLYKFRVPTKP
jgi:predicted acetyltransferase